MNDPVATLLAAQPAPRDPAVTALWSAVVTHTHLLRTGKLPAAEVPDLLDAWTAAHQVRAMGVGSPWEPVSSAAYRRCEHQDRDRYYAGQVPRAETMCEEHVHGSIAALNRRGGACQYYLDNETPKCRYGHLWYFGWTYLHPAWHDYDQDRPVQFNESDRQAEPNLLTGQPHRRRAYLEIVHEQRRHGALAVWAHPTSWWRDHGRFVTNIAAELPLQLHADGGIDGLAVMGYDPCHRAYQELWFHLLDTGATVPGFAETDSCFDNGERRTNETLLATRLPLGEDASIARIVAAARRGLAYATSGPHLTLSVDGTAMGSGVPTAAGQRHCVRVEAWPVPGEAALSRIELVGRGGRILARAQDFPGGMLEWGLEGEDQAGWILARAWGEHDDPDATTQQAMRSFAITNPVYLRHGAPFSQVGCAYRLGIAEDSPWAGGTVTFTDPDGLGIGSSHLRAGRTIVCQLPGNARVVLHRDGREHAFFISSEDLRVQALTRRLWAGEFLVGRDDLHPGQVPVADFQIDAMRQALAGASHKV